MFGLGKLSALFKRGGTLDGGRLILGPGMKEMMSYIVGLQAGDLSHSRDHGDYIQDFAAERAVLMGKMSYLAENDSFDLSAFQKGHVETSGRKYDMMDIDYLGVTEAIAQTHDGKGIRLREILELKNA